MKKLYFLVITLLITNISFGQTNVGITGDVDGVYINEIHYDNVGTDTGEFIEIAGPIGTDLTDYTLTLYNGNGSAAYATLMLSGTIDNEGSSMGSVHFTINDFSTTGIQNGSPGPDGVALSNSSTNIQFLSYEGTFSASGGAADGLTSIDIGVSETGTTPIGYSLEYDEVLTSWVVITDDTPGTFSQGNTLSTTTNTIAHFAIYPNPTSLGYINILSEHNSKMEVTVFDVLGKQITEQTVTNNKLDVTNLKVGVYIMNVHQDGATATKKLVIR